LSTFIKHVEDGIHKNDINCNLRTCKLGVHTFSKCIRFLSNVGTCSEYGCAQDIIGVKLKINQLKTGIGNFL
jgi:hypothetical protein